MGGLVRGLYRHAVCKHPGLKTMSNHSIGERNSSDRTPYEEIVVPEKAGQRAYPTHVNRPSQRLVFPAGTSSNAGIRSYTDRPPKRFLTLDCRHRRVCPSISLACLRFSQRKQFVFKIWIRLPKKALRATMSLPEHSLPCRVNALCRGGWCLVNNLPPNVVRQMG